MSAVPVTVFLLVIVPVVHGCVPVSAVSGNWIESLVICAVFPVSWGLHLCLTNPMLAPHRFRCRTLVFSKWCCDGLILVDFEYDDTCDKLVCFLRAGNHKAHHSTQSDLDLNIVVVVVVVVLAVVVVVVVVVVELIEFHWILVTHTLAWGVESWT